MREERDSLAKQSAQLFEAKTRIELDISDAREELDRERKNRVIIVDIWLFYHSVAYTFCLSYFSLVSILVKS